MTPSEITRSALSRHSRAKPPSPDEQAGGAEERDRAVEEPHRAAALGAVLRDKRLEDVSGVEARRRLRNEPGQTCDTHVLRDPAGRRELGGIFEKAGRPQRFADRE